MSKLIRFKMSTEFYNKLLTIPKKMNKDKTFIIKEALEKYLEEYSDYLIALNILKNIDDKIISFSEISKSILKIVELAIFLDVSYLTILSALYI